MLGCIFPRMDLEQQLAPTKPNAAGRSTYEGEFFPGQQEGERILYIARPHWVREFARALVLLIPAVGLFFFRHFLGNVLHLSPEWLLRGYLLIGIGVAMGLLASHLHCLNSRAYITDRRVYRFEGAIPVFQTRRSLFWSELAKVRTFTPTWFLKLMKIGHVELLSSAGGTELSMIVPYVYYFEDLGAYMEKLAFTFRNAPGEMKNIREFVPKPKGQRY